MNEFDELINKNEERNKRLEQNKYNCIPIPFKRFRNYYPGFERGKYIILTANQKVGKSKLSDFLFIYEPLFYMMDHPELKVKVLYFSLEMSKEEKMQEFMCHLLFKLDKIHLSTRILKGVDKKCPPYIHDLLRSEKYKKYLKAWANMVEVNDSVKNPTGINKKCREYALEHGHMNYIQGKVKNEFSGEWENGEIVDPFNPYTQDDEDEFRVILLDNAANITPEKGQTKAEAIEKMSKYGITLRKQLKYIFVLIQHQAQAQEGIENRKQGLTKPTTDGLGDCKTTSRDANCVMGLYSPYKFSEKTYEGYNIEKLKDYGRFLEVLEDRDYGANGKMCPLFFDGAVSRFKELPLPNETESIENYYNYVKTLEEERLRDDLELTNPK